MQAFQASTRAAEVAVAAIDEPQSPSPLDAVIQNSQPGLGQIVLGVLCLDGTELAANTPGLGLLKIGGSLVALDTQKVGCRVALSLTSMNSVLVLGLIWDGEIEEVQKGELLVDGEHLVIEAKHSIELRCGEAAIVLLADGRIQLRGTYITSHATATQRIVGGSVHVN